MVSVGQLAGVLSYKPKARGFDSGSGHMSRLQVWGLVGAHVKSNRLMFFFHSDVSLPLSHPSHSLKSISISLGKDVRMIINK